MFRDGLVVFRDGRWWRYCEMGGRGVLRGCLDGGIPRWAVRGGWWGARWAAGMVLRGGGVASRTGEQANGRTVGGGKGRGVSRSVIEKKKTKKLTVWVSSLPGMGLRLRRCGWQMSSCGVH